MNPSNHSQTVLACSLAAAWLVLGVIPIWSAPPVGTATTYQGELTQNGTPVNGTCDCQFSLWDDSNGGLQVGPTLTFDGQGGNPPSIAIADGVLTVELDFGAGVINGEQRWLQISVACPPGGALQSLTPRQPLTAAPYALYALTGPGGAGGFWSDSGADIFNTNAGNVGIGTSTPARTLEVADSQSIFRMTSTAGNSGSVIELRNNTESPTLLGAFNFLNDIGSTRGQIAYRAEEAMTFRTNQSERMRIDDAGNVGIGTTTPTAKLEVDHAATTGAVSAILGSTASTFGRAVVGHASATTGDAWGVLGQSDSTGGAGVLGYTLANSGTNYGVWGWNNSTQGRGVWGLNTAASGNNYGVYGQSNSTSGTGVYGEAADGTGVRGLGTSGVVGTSNSATGYGGTFGGSGGFGSGRALFIAGDTHAVGRVGIGTTTPAVKLDVVGSVRSEGLDVAGEVRCETLEVTQESIHKGYQIVSHSEPTDGNHKHVSVQCPGDMKVLGGGCTTTANSDAVLANTNPTGDSGWHCWYIDTQDGHSATAYAICADID